MKAYDKQDVCLYLSKWKARKVLQLSNNFFDKLKQKVLFMWLQCSSENTTWDQSTRFQYKQQSHAYRVYIYKVFSNKRRVWKISQHIREGEEEEISKSERRSFTLLSTLPSVNAAAYYLAGSLSLWTRNQSDGLARWRWLQQWIIKVLLARN